MVPPTSRHVTDHESLVQSLNHIPKLRFLHKRMWGEEEKRVLGTGRITHEIETRFLAGSHTQTLKITGLCLWVLRFANELHAPTG